MTQTTSLAWVAADDMLTSQRGWYWAEFPGSWVFFSPEMNATRDIDHGNTGWNPLISGRYWGPWTELSIVAEASERDKFERAWNEVSDRYEALLNQMGATDA